MGGGSCGLETVTGPALFSAVASVPGVDSLQTKVCKSSCHVLHILGFTLNLCISSELLLELAKSYLRCRNMVVVTKTHVIKQDSSSVGIIGK